MKGKRTRFGADIGALFFLLAIFSTMTVPATIAAAEARPADWFNIVRLDAGTYALSEPHYWQANVNYLLLGNKRAILFDTGPGVHHIRDVVAAITPLPVLVIPSHLHFDHVGRAAEFNELALPDVPALRAAVRDGNLAITPDQFMLTSGATLRVTDWLADGETIDLGGRSIQVAHTPGHTPDSISLVDVAGRRIFVGDLINRDITLANVPGADIHQMAASVQRLLTLAPPGSTGHEAHSETPLSHSDLVRFSVGLLDMAGDRAPLRAACLGGVPMRRHDIGQFPVLVPDTDDRRLRPLGSATEEIAWLVDRCS